MHLLNFGLIDTSGTAMPKIAIDQYGNAKFMPSKMVWDYAFNYMILFGYGDTRDRI